MINFKTDENGELLLNANGSFIDLTLKESIAQNCKSRLRTKKGEWFLNIKTGVDYKNGLRKGGQSLLIYSIKTELLQVPGVVSIQNVVTSFDKNLRKGSLSCTIKTEEGDIYFTEPI